jgi:hypothetical protein
MSVFGTPRLVQTTPGVPFQSRKVRLEGRDFILQLAWNQREAGWYLSILDEEATPLVMGLKVLANWRMLRQYYNWDPRVPPGEFVATDLTGGTEPPGLNELGVGLRCELTYFESS